MNRKLFSALMAVAVMCFSIPAFAEIQISNNGTRAGQFRKINLPAGSSIANNGDLTFNDGTASASFTNVTDSGLTASQFVTTDGSKVLSSTGTSAALAATLSDETGTGVAVFGTTPTLTTPVIGAATGTSLTLSGASTFQTSLLANGRYGSAAWTLASSSTGGTQSSLPYAIIQKLVAGAGTSVDNNPGFTLINGLPGQVLVIEVIGLMSGGTFVVTPTNKTGYRSVTFDTKADTATFTYDTTLGWLVTANSGAIINVD